MRTLRGKLVLVIVLGISIVMGISIGVISFVISDNIKTDISEDMELILNYSKSEIIGNINLEGDANSFILIDGIAKLFNCYVSFEDEFNNHNYAGKIKVESTIEKYKNLEEKKKMLLSINNEDEKMIGTSFYPLYKDTEYIGNIVIQREYTSKHQSYIRIKDTIIRLQFILFGIFVLVMYIIIRKSTKPLEGLTQVIKNFGEGKKRKMDFKINKDEIGTLAKEFEIMEKKITSLQSESKDFFNRATHELKTPLTAIKGYSELLCDEAFEDEFVITAIERVNEESNKMTKLVENLLIISRQDARINTYKEDVDLEKTINNILKSLELTISSRGMDVLVDLKCKSIEIFKSDFEIILNNLINNSVKYSEGKSFKVKTKVAKNEFIFEVANKINIEKMPSRDIFKPFVKEEGRDEISSSGLGLYICKRICEKNNWEIKYEIIKEQIVFTLIVR
ncbi:MAG: histidine kinase dimerization/phospho-acceptor domain-containing protein [Sarcina sp.]